VPDLVLARVLARARAADVVAHRLPHRAAKVKRVLLVRAERVAAVVVAVVAVAAAAVRAGLAAMALRKALPARRSALAAPPGVRTQGPERMVLRVMWAMRVVGGMME
jgi:hypothetical protein